MAKSRNSSRGTLNNQLERDADLRIARGKPSIRHYMSPRMRYPPKSLRDSLHKTVHVWSSGDRYWKLAAKYYSDPTLWWVIAWYNLKPTDAHCSIGDNLIIPGPVGKIVQYYSTS